MKVDVTLYYANWCGHCMDYKPTYNEIKEHFNNNDEINFYEVEDSNITEMDTINNQKIFAYPTIKIKTENNEFKYNGDRTKDGLINEINNLKNIENFDDIKDDSIDSKFMKLKNLIITKNSNYNKIFKKYNTK